MSGEKGRPSGPIAFRAILGGRRGPPPKADSGVGRAPVREGLLGVGFGPWNPGGGAAREVDPAGAHRHTEEGGAIQGQATSTELWNSPLDGNPEIRAPRAKTNTAFAGRGYRESQRSPRPGRPSGGCEEGMPDCSCSLGVRTRKKTSFGNPIESFGVRQCPLKGGAERDLVHVVPPVSRLLKPNVGMAIAVIACGHRRWVRRRRSGRACRHADDRGVRRVSS